MRGYISLAKSVRMLRTDEQDVRDLRAAGKLNVDANGHYSIVSIDRMLAERRWRFGNFLSALRKCADGNSQPIERIYAAVGAPASESSGAEGGFLVPTEYVDEILAPLSGGSGLVGRARKIPVKENITEVPRAPRPPYAADTIRATYTHEADAITQTKPTFGVNELKQKKLGVLVHVSGEVGDDSRSIGAYVEKATRDAFDWRISYDMLWGTAGQVSGFMHSAAPVRVEKEDAQAADTIVGANVVKMHGAMPANSLISAIWLANPRAFPQLISVTTGSQNLYSPQADDDAPHGRMLGRPIIISEVCSELGDEGDIIFVDPTQYMLAMREPSMSALSSLHCSFDRDLQAFRFMMRIDGMSSWAEPAKSCDGNSDVSPFVTLKVRA